MRFFEWMYSEGEEVNLSYLFSPPSHTKQIGRETGYQVGDGIARYVSPHGSYRYVFYFKSQPIGALQVVKQGRTKAIVANVFVHPDYRRQKIATFLLDRAKQDFRYLSHQPYENLSDDAKSWVASFSD